MAKDLMKTIDPMGTLKMGIEFVIVSMLIGAAAAMLGLGAYLASPLAELTLPTIVGLLLVIALSKVVDEKIPM